MTAEGELRGRRRGQRPPRGAIQRGDIKEADVRVIYKSSSFPPATIGCLYNLKPELAVKIKSCLARM